MAATAVVIILTIILGLAIILIVRLANIILLWREAYYLKEKSCEFQRETIENQIATINHYKSALSKGITGMTINDKIGAN